MSQEGDVLLQQTNEGGEITVSAGLVEMTTDLRTAVYLSLFGGNDEGKWWGDVLDEDNPDRQYHCKTQKIINSSAMTPANIRTIEVAAESDLLWLVSNNYVKKISVDARIIAPKKLKIIINVDGSDIIYYQNFGV